MEGQYGALGIHGEYARQNYEGFVHEVVVEVWRVRLYGAWWRRFTREGGRHWRGEREARVKDRVWEWGCSGGSNKVDMWGCGEGGGGRLGSYWSWVRRMSW